MYQQDEPATVLESVAFSAVSGLICGGLYAAMLFTMDEVSLGLMFGLVLGLLVSPIVVAIHRNCSIANTGCASLVLCVVLIVVAGVTRFDPGLTLLGVIGAFLVTCAVVARYFPAVRRIELFMCESCGYDLRGVRDVRCPECGRERIVLPKSVMMSGQSAGADGSADVARAVENSHDVDPIGIRDVENEEGSEP